MKEGSGEGEMNMCLFFQSLCCASSLFPLSSFTHYSSSSFPLSSLTLCLDGIEEGKFAAVEVLVGRVPEGCHRERLQIQQFSWWRKLLWEDEVAERHWQLCL